MIAIDQIVPNPYQPRRTFNEASLNELAASMKSAGLIQPIIVRRAESGYQLIAGERRWRAAKIAGLTALPAIVRDIDSLTQAQMALVENIHREDLNAIDRGLAYHTLLTQLGLTQVELATRLGEDRSTIGHYVRLLDLAEPVREGVRQGKLSLGHAKLLSGVADLLEQTRLAGLIESQDLSVRNLERILQNGLSSLPSIPPKTSSAHLSELERSLTAQLGMRIQLRASSSSKGRLVIHYRDLDQFDSLIHKLGLDASGA